MYDGGGGATDDHLCRQIALNLFPWRCRFGPCGVEFAIDDGSSTLTRVARGAAMVELSITAVIRDCRR